MSAELDACIRRHPAGRKLLNSRHTATVIPFPRATIDATANAETTTEKGTHHV